MRPFYLTYSVTNWSRIQLSFICCKVIYGIHNLEGKPIYHLSKKYITSVWNNITNASIDIPKVGLGFYDFFSFNASSASWRCTLSLNDFYIVEKLRCIWDHFFLHNPTISSPTNWCKYVPIIVLCFMFQLKFYVFLGMGCAGSL